MAFDVESARKAGYSDAEIADYLAKDMKFDSEAARKSGYSDSEIVSHLTKNGGKVSGDGAKKSSSVLDLLKPGSAGNTLPGVIETAATLGSGFGASVLGGLRGMYHLAADNDIDKAGNAVRETQDALTYRPRGKAGQAQVDLIGKAGHAVFAPLRLAADIVRGGGPKFGPYTAYDWGPKTAEDFQSKEDSGGVSDFLATTLNVAGESAPLVFGAGRLPTSKINVDPRRILAESRIRDAFDPIPQSSLRQGIEAQKYAASRGTYLAPSQAMEREFPTLSALERELRGSMAPNAKTFQQYLNAQPEQAADFANLIALRHRPYNTVDVAAQQVKDAATSAAGDIRRAPNFITRNLYQSAESAPGVVPAERINSIVDQIKATQRANPGRTDLNVQLDSLLERIRETRLIAQADEMKRGGRPIFIDETPMPSNMLVNVSDSFSRQLKDFSVANPSQGQWINTRVSSALGLLDDAAREATPDLARATNVQRGLRPDYSVGDFNMLERMTKSGGDPQTYIKRALGGETVDPAAFRAFADRVSEQNINAFRDGVGQYIAQARDQSFKYGADGKLNPAAGVDFSNALVGTKNKRAAFRIALEKASEGIPGLENPKAFTDGTIKLLDLTRNLSKQVGTDISRIQKTEIGSADIARTMFGHQLMQRAGGVTIIKSLFNKLSDNMIAGMITDPNSIQLMTRVGEARSMAETNKAISALLAYEASLDSGQVDRRSETR